ncbi:MULTISPECIES: mannose-binding protein [Streptomyces]|uniref:Mannose-binding protein n=1 Tax=Streptomyces glycanivorans TaxID=3033808 RepID=A0ABY9J9H5_9ACTN|nr:MULTISPECIES: mannose-binding protein [unclassified Streptomyces]WLQ63604.1 mannose-binding protein [Streptomyces sp. Alt3]WSQ84317.1 mannose-binding protein [Streptomyces sp. NBC_01212]
MSSQPPTPGANTTVAATPDAEAAGSRPASPEPAPAEGAPALAAAPEAESGATPAGDTAATPPPAAKAAAPEASEEGVGVTTAAVTAPGTTTATGVHAGRPRTPVLAGAAFLGAALVAIPLLLVGSANDKGGDETPMRPVAGGADTVLNPNSAPAALDDYVAGKPSPSPTKEKPKPVEPKAAAPVVPAPEPTPSPSATKPKAKAKPKPKPSPKPEWSTVVISAPSVIQVNQAWTTNRIKMVMQTDGNLVVLNEHGKPIWAAMTFGQNHRAIFQPDGNLVIHNGDDRAIWASKTHDHPGAQLVLRADGKVVVTENGNVLWST